jgi:hypothetical protein
MMLKQKHDGSLSSSCSARISGDIYYMFAALNYYLGMCVRFGVSFSEKNNAAATWLKKQEKIMAETEMKAMEEIIKSTVMRLTEIVEEVQSSSYQGRAMVQRFIEEIRGLVQKLQRSPQHEEEVKHEEKNLSN